MSAQARKNAQLVKWAEHCLRCGVPRDPGYIGGIGALCWAPGAEHYRERHQWKERHPKKHRERDEARLAAWRKDAKP
mgnify:CR=1 FL=1